MTVQDLIQNLKAAGLEEEQIAEYLSCWRAGETREQLKLLAAKRAVLLGHVHQKEKQIDCLDIWSIRSKKDRQRRNRGRRKGKGGRNHERH